MSKIIDQIKKDKLIQYIWKKISELWGYSKFLLIVAIAILVLPILFYNDLAIYFAKDNYKGEFFKVILTSIGGLGVLYGLYLNSERIKQGNKQLEQQEENSTNTRFKDAVTLLGNENPAIVLGGIHTLNQIAIDYPEYREVISKILCSYVRVLYDKLEGTQNYNNYISVFQLIVDYIFTDIYSEFVLDFSNVYFDNIKFKNQILPNIIIDNTKFNSCEFIKFDLCNNLYQNISFNNCIFDKVQFLDIRMNNSVFSNCVFKSEFTNIANMIGNTLFKGCIFKNFKINYSHLFGLIITNCVFDVGEIISNTFEVDCSINSNNFFNVVFDNSQFTTNYVNNNYVNTKD